MTATSRAHLPPGPAPAGTRGSGAWTALAVVAASQFLAVMSTTVVSVALPAIGVALHASATSLLWIVDVYVIVYSALLVAGGVIGDRRGRKGVFLLGVVIFGLGSLLNALAPSAGWLLAGRAVQGLGPALLVPGSLTIIRSLFTDGRDRALAIGLWSMCSGLALAAGPVLGGLIVEYAGWRWVFGINVPLSAVLAAVAARFVPRIARTPPRGRFDWAGAILATTGVAAIAYALIEEQPYGWGSPLVFGAATVCLAALGAFVVIERRVAEPLVDVTLFRRPAFTAANVAALVVFFAFVGAIVFFSAYFQQVQGRSPVAAGLEVSVIGVAFALAAPLSGRLVGRVGPRLPMLAGLAIAGAATLGLLRLGPHTGTGAIWWDFALLGGGVGLSLTPMTAVAVAAVGAARAGMVSAVHNALRQLGQVLGIAVLGALVYGRLPAGSSAGGQLGPVQAALFMSGLHEAVLVSGLALLAAAVLGAALLPREHRAGSSVPGAVGRNRNLHADEAVAIEAVGRHVVQPYPARSQVAEPVGTWCQRHGHRPGPVAARLEFVKSWLPAIEVTHHADRADRTGTREAEGDPGLSAEQARPHEHRRLPPSPLAGNCGGTCGTGGPRRDKS
jgi:DHA2 family methylenomycin A resistance protein-like MFS transporter